MSAWDRFPSPDIFDGIYARVSDYLMWDVIGRRGNETDTVTSNIANKPLAEAFIRWYTDGYWKEQLEGPQDC
jgi:hypothetical protein